MAYKDLNNELNRSPMKKEWESRCRDTSVSFRIRKIGTTDNPYAITSFKDLKKRAEEYNHRVVRIEWLEEKQDVYNISVEDNHTVGIVTKQNDISLCGIMTSNCVEQSLESFELCCLVESFPSRHKTLQEYMDTLKLAYLYAKTVTLVPTHWPETNAVMLRNRRIGCSQSGITNAFDIHGRREVLRWCDKGYEYISGLDKQYSEWLCVPESIKRTSVKPSGTVSLLPPNINPGIHRGPAEFYIRRMRIAKNSELVPHLQRAGYPIEPSATNPDDTVVVTFPIHDTTFTTAESDVSMWEQLENAAQYQYYWADNSVSVTIKFKPEEAHEIPHALELYETQLKAVSFLPHANHGYVQTPLEPISKEEYNRLMKQINTDLLYGTISEVGDGGKNLYCDSEKCELITG